MSGPDSEHWDGCTCEDCGPFVKGAVPMRWEFDTLLNNLSAAAIDLPASGAAFEAARAALCRAFDSLLAERDTAIQKRESMSSHLTLVLEELKQAQANVRTATTSRSDVWFWQGDGNDEPESLACPVVMEPQTLRAILAERDAALLPLPSRIIWHGIDDENRTYVIDKLRAEAGLFALLTSRTEFQDKRLASLKAVVAALEALVREDA